MGPPVLALSFVLTLSLGPLGSAPACLEAPVQLGSQGAPTQVDAFIDPTSTEALGAVLELRRMVGERAGEVSVQVHWTHLGIRLDPRADRVRLWVAAMAARGHTLPALRAVRRDGVDRTYVRLSTAHGRASLAQSVGLDPGGFDAVADEMCHGPLMERTRLMVAERMADRGTAVFRLPVFIVDDLVFEDSGLLDRLRPVLARRGSRARVTSERAPAPIPPAKGASPRLMRPDLRAGALGGPGLPHAFVVMAREEDDPALFNLLPPVLAYRREHPGEVSVSIVSQGLGLQKGLRGRLCAAQRRGLLPAYVHWLSEDPSMRAIDPASDPLLAILDQEVAGEPPCDLDPREDEESLPNGGWLDGVPVTRADLESIGPALTRARATRRPLAPLLAPAADDL